MIAGNYADPGIALRHLERLDRGVARRLDGEPTPPRSPPTEATGAPILDELAATSRARLPRARRRRPGLRRLLPARDADRRDRDAPARLTTGRPRPATGDRRGHGARRTARSPTSGRSRGSSPGRRRGSTCPAGSGSGRRSRRTPPTTARRASRARPALPRAGRSSPASSTTPSCRSPGPTSASPASTRRSPGRRRTPAAGRPSRPSTHRTVAWLARLTGRERLLDGDPELRRRIGLRDPYVDSLSALQVMLLARLRACAPDDPERDRLLRLVQLTVNGIAAGLQATGLTAAVSLARDDDSTRSSFRRARPCSRRRPAARPSGRRPPPSRRSRRTRVSSSIATVTVAAAGLRDRDRVGVDRRDRPVVELDRRQAAV